MLDFYDVNYWCKKCQECLFIDSYKKYQVYTTYKPGYKFFVVCVLSIWVNTECRFFMLYVMFVLSKILLWYKTLYLRVLFDSTTQFFCSLSVLFKYIPIVLDQGNCVLFPNDHDLTYSSETD